VRFDVVVKNEGKKQKKIASRRDGIVEERQGEKQTN
jgi:hypothetical protein